jgi:hypothetical protein
MHPWPAGSQGPVIGRSTIKKLAPTAAKDGAKVYGG